MDKPNFALLIGKKLDSKDGEKPDMEKDLMPEDDGSEKEQMEDSALSDFISAVHSKDVALAKGSLRQFIELCYHESEEPKTEA